MRISKDGEIKCDWLLLDSNTCKADFLQSASEKYHETFVANPPWESFKVPLTEWIIIALFFHERLDRVFLTYLLPGDTNSWENWSKDQELGRKRFHDSWLKRSIGEPPYKYDWGCIRSEYSERDGSSDIVITYLADPGV